MNEADISPVANSGKTAYRVKSITVILEKNQVVDIFLK